MKRERLRKAALILLILAFLFVSISAAFALAVRTGCCIDEVGSLCQNFAMMRENLRRFAGTLVGAAGLFTFLLLLQFIAGELLIKQSTLSLVSLKARMNR